MIAVSLVHSMVPLITVNAYTPPDTLVALTAVCGEATLVYFISVNGVRLYSLLMSVVQPEQV